MATSEAITRRGVSKPKLIDYNDRKLHEFNVATDTPLTFPIVSIESWIDFDRRDSSGTRTNR